MHRKAFMVLIGAQFLVGCSDDTKGTPVFDAGALPVDAAVTNAPMDASTSDAGVAADASRAAPVADCFPAPKTYLELINACTDAERVDKEPVLPLLGPDGGLPPLP